MVDANIFIARKLLLTQKSLTKLESLPTQKSSTEPSFKADAQIFSAYRLLLTHKPLTKSLRPRNHQRDPVLRLMLKSSAYINYCWLRNRWRKQSLSIKKSSSKPSSMADTEIFSAPRQLLTHKLLTKLSRCRRRNHQRKLVLWLT
jgi:hypothetical protein